MKIYRLFISFLILILLSLPAFLPWKNLGVFSSIINTEFDLVTILVEPSLLDNSELSNKISRYAKDVQNSYKNTKVIIVPVNIEIDTNTSEKIYRLLENWYFSGLIQNENKYFLTGVILVGDIELPKLISPVGDIPSIYPYTDFKDPVFIWDTEELKWIKNSESNFTNAEIWHGMIVGTNEELLKYFDKNHNLHISLKKGDSNIKDKILFWDAFSESESSYPLILGQYEKGWNIIGDRKEFRYDKAMNMSDLNIPMEDVPIRQLRSIIENFFPKYAEVVKGYELDVQQIIQSTGRWDKSDMDSIPAMISVIDEYVANEIKKMNAEAADKIYGLFSSAARPIAIAEGQYGRRPLLQSEYEEWKIKQEERDEEISAIKKSRATQIASMKKSGASEESISSIENAPLPERIEIPEYKDVEVENYLYGRNASGIDSADDCTIYKGTANKSLTYPYKTYGNWEVQSEKFLNGEGINSKNNDDIGIFFNQDPLASAPSVQVEFNKVHEFKLSGGNCKALGGCCSSNDPSACVVSKAIQPIFSWQGGENSVNSGVKFIDSGVPSRTLAEDPETSGDMCKVFNFTEPDIYTSPEKGKLQSANKLYGKVIIGGSTSLQMHGHPSEKYDQSLKNSLSNKFAKFIPINRSPYIDMIIGDNIFQQYLKIDLPDFFRFKYNKLSRHPLQTKNELSEFALYFDRRIVGGNTVSNKNKQYGNSLGLAVMPVSFRVQKIIHYKDIKKSESFAIYDDNNKLPVDYALPLTLNIEKLIGGGSSKQAYMQGNDIMVDFVEGLEKEKLAMEQSPAFDPSSILYKSIDYKINHIKPQVDMTRDYSNLDKFFEDNSIEAQMARIGKKIASLQEEQKKYVSGALNGTRAGRLGIPKDHKIFLNFAIAKEGKHHGLGTWEAKAIGSVGNSIIASLLGASRFSSKLVEISTQSRNYGQLIDPSHYFLHNKSYNNIDTEEDLNKYLIPLSEIKEDYFKNVEYKLIPLSKSNPPFWLSKEVIETLPDEDGELYLEISEVLAVSGESFPSGLPLGGKTYMGDNKLILPNKGQSSDPRHDAVGTIKMTGSTSLVFPAKEKTYIDPEEEYERYEVTRDMFYNSAVVENSTDCNGKCHRLLPYINPGKLTKADTLSLTQSLLDSKSAEELDFLFRWKDMTAAEKHHTIQKILLDKNDKSIKGLNKDPYAYVHWRVTGDTHPIWKAEDAKLNFDEIEKEEKDPQTEVDENRKKPDSPVEQNEKCAPLEGVPLHKWIPSVLCWIKEVKNTGIEFKHQCALAIDEFKGLFSDALKDEIKSVEIEPVFNPLISGVENVVGIAFFTEAKEYAKGKRVHFTVFLEGVEVTSIVPDQDSEKEGIQLSDADGLEQIEFIPYASEVKISVEAVYNGQTLKTEKVLEVEGDQSFYFEEVKTDVIDNVKSYTFKVKPNKKVEKFEGKISLQVKPSSEVVLSKDFVKLDEEFSLAVRTDKEVLLLASLRGVKVATKKLSGEEGLNSDIEIIKIPDLPHTVSFYQTLELPIKFYNALGTEKKIKEDDINSLKITNFDNKNNVSLKIIKKEDSKTKEKIPYLKIKTGNNKAKLNFTLELEKK